MNVMLDHLLPSLKPQYFLEWTRTSLEQSLLEFYTIHVRGGNLFLTLVSKIDQSGSMLFKFGDCAGQGRCWSSSSRSSNHDWTVPVVWMGTLSSWKIASMFENSVWIMDAHITQPVHVHVFPCNNSALKGNNGTKSATQTTTEPPPYFTVGSRHSGL
jgi:hypothetical protein